MPTAGRRAAASRDTLLLLGGMLMLALAFRLPSLNDSLFQDELSTNYVVNGFGVDSLFGLVGSDQEVTPPGYFLLAWLGKGLGAEGIRLPALFAGLASIPLVYVLGMRTVGRPAATVAAAMMVLSPFQIYYATEARAYSLVMMLGLVAALLLLKASDDGRAGGWVAYGLCAAAAAYVHYTALLLLAGMFGWAFFARPQCRKPLLISSLGAAALFAPWIPHYLNDVDAPNGSRLTEVLHPFTFALAKGDLQDWSFGHPVIPGRELPGTFATYLILAGLALGAVGLALRLRGGMTWRPSSGLVLVLVLACAVPVGAGIYSLIGNSVFGARYLIASWPGFALTLGALLTAGRGPLRIAAVGLLLGGTAIGAVKVLDVDQQRPDMEAAADYIERTGDPGAPVLEIAQLTPGPQTPVEAALAPRGQFLSEDREVLAFGRPLAAERLHIAAPGGPGVLDTAPIPTDKQLFREAAKQAGDGTLFLVGPGGASIEYLRDAFLTSRLIAAVPPRFHEVEYRDFPGLSVYPIRVHVLEGRAGAGEG